VHGRHLAVPLGMSSGAPEPLGGCIALRCDRPAQLSQAQPFEYGWTRDAFRDWETRLLRLTPALARSASCCIESLAVSV
jgi:hypothetical protein